MNVGHDEMSVFECDASKDLMVRLKNDADLVQSMTELAGSRGIEAGSFTAIGALKRARIGYYYQKNHKYREMEIESPHEIVSCIGNISLSEGKPFVHVHVVLADEKHVRQLEGLKLERIRDEATGLWLWGTGQGPSYAEDA
jgi:predicted DNA-binding protein with PD1-like motif